MFPKRNDTRPDRHARWETWRPWFLGSIIFAALVGTAASFYESFSGLVGWFRLLGFTGERAIIAPAMVNLVAIVGDIFLAVMIICKWDKRHKVLRAFAWGCVGYGLVLSIIGNAGRDGFRGGLAGWFRMAWYASPPVSLTLLMIAALAVVKLWFTDDEDETAPLVAGEVTRALVVFSGHVTAGTLPTYPEVRAALGCGQAKAGLIRSELTAATALMAEPGEQDRAA